MIQQFNEYLIYYFGQQYSKIYNIIVLLVYCTHYNHDTCPKTLDRNYNLIKFFFFHQFSLSFSLSHSFPKPVATKSRPLSFHSLRERQKERNISNNERTPLGTIANLHCLYSLSLSPDFFCP